MMAGASIDHVAMKPQVRSLVCDSRSCSNRHVLRRPLAQTFLLTGVQARITQTAASVGHQLVEVPAEDRSALGGGGSTTSRGGSPLPIFTVCGLHRLEVWKVVPQSESGFRWVGRMGEALDGGRVAARGFQYQYLRTLEQLVTVLDEPGIDCVRVEGPPASEGAVDQVDFDVVDLEGAVRLAAQVKSRAAGGSMSAAVALGILLEMINGDHEAGTYCLLTNGRPGPKSDQLDEILASTPGPQVLRDRLMELFRDAPQRRSQLEGLNENGLARLGRCRVEYDARDDGEIREQLRESLRTIRNHAHQGLGEKSAGLLTGYLISEILDRAADVSGRRASFSVAELRRLVLVDGETLARSIGMRDWGAMAGPVPTVPDVDRPELLGRLLASFPLKKSQVTRRATMVGPSGIGKSSAATLFISARADAYDFVGWIDCETEYSTRASFQRAVAALNPNSPAKQPEAQVEDLLQAVQRELGQLPGRWLLVCDNANSAREINPWIPKVGGDALITTLNAASHLGNGDVVHVSVMGRGESVELLSRRLHLTEDEREFWQPSLKRLAEELGDWPLALELGAGYLYSTGLGLDYTDHYLQELKVRSFSDEDSVPPGYPRTLAAALNLCIDRLEARTRPEVLADSPSVALQMLFASAFLASHQMPTHLLLAAAIADIEALEPGHHGPVLVPTGTANLGEALRELYRFSLIKNDLPLPPSYGESLPGAERTITVNTVSQALIRDRLNGHPALPGAMNQLTGHVERWLRGASELGELERVQILQSHAETLLGHIEKNGFTSERVALMYGNLASPYYLQGNALRAEELMLRELDHLARLQPTNLALVAQTRFALATIFLQTQDISTAQHTRLTTTFDEAVRHLEYVLHQARLWADEYPKAALKFAIDGRTLIRNSDFPAPESTRLTLLGDAFTDLESRIAPTAYSITFGTIERAENLLRQHRYAEAEQCCRELLSEKHSGSVDPEVRRRLIEALALQAKWDQAIDEVRYWKESHDAPRLFRTSILDLIRNVCYACAVGLASGDMRAVALLNEVLDWPDLDSFLHLGSDIERKVITEARDLRDELR
ncbi:hypothetical protein Kpho02_57050 [Kitasatospora phosalacinea]|uniref:NB-ARC domain-containing protein n=2 Tax=Kitasatospora phosalacinea TaxID=2065 RepID=A0A9W6QDE2_9ACTN|nr:hypothetical protein Kpho02_57050 [Kitasatospora phosalacinea]